ncbi:hypothetical protein HYS10_01170 [Candidatus Collierbacteria bacterium]|nr:hypothetical protein [Candidatus Collierbacteria bacterium]
MMKRRLEAGVSVLEIVITLSILSVVSVASVWLVFTTLSLRDKALATTLTQESLRVFTAKLRLAVLNANVVSGTSTSLLLTSASECWSFVYDSVAQNIRYSQILSSGCTPDPNPSTNFFPTITSIGSITFTINPLATGGRQVTATGVVKTTLPFDNYQTSFADTFTNVVD